MYYRYLFTIHSPPFFGPLWVISPSSVSLLTAFSIARVDIPIASAISRSDTFGLDCIISLIFTEVFTELSTELFPEPWSDCSVELGIKFFLDPAVQSFVDGVVRGLTCHGHRADDVRVFDEVVICHGGIYAFLNLRKNINESFLNKRKVAIFAKTNSR